MSLLHIEDLRVCYGGIVALDGISFDVEEHEIVTLIGANGAGKSTTLRAIMGLVPLAGGTITYDGQRLDGLDTRRIVGKGIVLVPEGRRVFANLTTLENLRLGAYLQKDNAVMEANLERVYTLFPRLKSATGSLRYASGGEQQSSEAGRDGRSKLIMMDEPSLGLAPWWEEIFSIIRRVNERESRCLSSNRMERGMRTANRGYCGDGAHTRRTALHCRGRTDQVAYLGKTVRSVVSLQVIAEVLFGGRNRDLARIEDDQDIAPERTHTFRRPRSVASFRDGDRALVDKCASPNPIGMFSIEVGVPIEPLTGFSLDDRQKTQCASCMVAKTCATVRCRATDDFGLS